MTRIYLVRHCETDGNAKKIFQGHTDLDINQLGAKQLKALGERFSTVELDAVFTSPLLRTNRTAAAIVGDREIKVYQNGGLIELNGGAYEGKTYDEIGNEFPDFWDVWKNRPWDFAPPMGEKMTDCYNRIWNTVTKIAEENKDKTIAAATHGGVLRCLFCKILKNDIEQLCEIPFGDNTCVSLLEFDDKMTPSLIYFNDSSHLSEELKNKNAKVPLKC